jgi:hypothetical protein
MSMRWCANTKREHDGLFSNSPVYSGVSRLNLTLGHVIGPELISSPKLQFQCCQQNLWVWSVKRVRGLIFKGAEGVADFSPNNAVLYLLPCVKCDSSGKQDFHKRKHKGCVYNRDLHRRQDPFFVAHKTITKPSTYVKFVIQFEGAANPTHNLSLCSPHNHNW